MYADEVMITYHTFCTVNNTREYSIYLGKKIRRGFTAGQSHTLGEICLYIYYQSSDKFRLRGMKLSFKKYNGLDA